MREEAEVIGNRMVSIKEFRSALGRLSFMMSAFKRFKPFLSPLYSWVCAVSDAPSASTAHHDPSVPHKREVDEEETDHWFRPDAKAHWGWCSADSKDGEMPILIGPPNCPSGRSPHWSSWGTLHRSSPSMEKRGSRSFICRQERTTWAIGM